jgi:hypothetical protein
LGNGSVSGEKSLGVTRRFASLHPALALPRRAMRILTPVIEVATLPMLYTLHHFALGHG